jgi:hypothetical protein
VARRKVAQPRRSDMPRFRTSATGDLESRGHDAVAAARVRLRQAFTPAQPVSDPLLFAGRRALLADLIRDIEDLRVHTIVYGRRGIGKTSILHVLAKAASEARYIVTYVSCGAATSFDEAFRAIMSDIPLSFHKSYGPTTIEAEQGRTFADLMSPEPVSPRLASDICTRVVGTRVLVIFDEFDRTGSVEFRRNLSEFLKNLSDRSSRVQLLIAAVAENLDELIEPGVMTHRNVVAQEVPPMSPPEIAALIETGQEASGLTFDPEALELLSHAANGLPYIASLFAQHAGLTALDAERLRVNRQDVGAAVRQALREMRSRLPRRSHSQLNNLNADGAHILLGPLAARAIINGGSFGADDIQQVSASPLQAARLRTIVERLAAEHDILTSQEGAEDGFRFTDDNLLPYLWLVSVEAELEGQDEPPAEIRRTAKARPEA